MRAALDKRQFGPWALVTGASSGIGKEFTRQIAATGINVVLVARRESLLSDLGRGLPQNLDVKYRVIAMDLSQEGFIDALAENMNDLDIGLVVSNAGTGNPGEFLKLDRRLLEATLRLNTMAHLDIAHHFGRKLAQLLPLHFTPLSRVGAFSTGFSGLTFIRGTGSLSRRFRRQY